uniref:Uncharacterized protein n=1 Tax=Setaria viridis TaxID=4556 RepID=A0A4U6TSY1_SETVI|nr:hypothetical protein SEVIR_7G069500v2 [Setaria viridis]
MELSAMEYLEKEVAVLWKDSSNNLGRSSFGCPGTTPPGSLLVGAAFSVGAMPGLNVFFEDHGCGVPEHSPGVGGAPMGGGTIQPLFTHYCALLSYYSGSLSGDTSTRGCVIRYIP